MLRNLSLFLLLVCSVAEYNAYPRAELNLYALYAKYNTQDATPEFKADFKQKFTKALDSIYAYSNTLRKDFPNLRMGDIKQSHKITNKLFTYILLEAKELFAITGSYQAYRVTLNDSSGTIFGRELKTITIEYDEPSAVWDIQFLVTEYQEDYTLTQSNDAVCYRPAPICVAHYLYNTETEQVFYITQ